MGLLETLFSVQNIYIASGKKTNGVSSGVYWAAISAFENTLQKSKCVAGDL